jgi:small subunit ribosomal protein S2
MRNITLMEMLKAGVHFGHKKSLWNPKMAPYIFTTRNGIHILDLEKTHTKLMEALNFAREVAARGGVVLFVGTKRQAKEEVKKAAESCGMPYVVTRWLGGTFTNFRTIQKTIKKMDRLQKMMDSGEVVKYTKKEQLMIKREVEKMGTFFSGIKDMNKLPDAIFVLDAKYDEIPVEEARQSKVKVIGVVDTNTDPTNVNYVIPSNDDAVKVISFMAQAMAEAVNEGRSKMAQNIMTQTEGAAVAK